MHTRSARSNQTGGREDEASSIQGSAPPKRGRWTWTGLAIQQYLHTENVPFLLTLFFPYLQTLTPLFPPYQPSYLRPYNSSSSFCTFCLSPLFPTIVCFPSLSLIFFLPSHLYVYPFILPSASFLIPPFFPDHLGHSNPLCLCTCLIK